MSLTGTEFEFLNRGVPVFVSEQIRKERRRKARDRRKRNRKRGATQKDTGLLNHGTGTNSTNSTTGATGSGKGEEEEEELVSVRFLFFHFVTNAFVLFTVHSTHGLIESFSLFRYFF